MNNYTQIKDNRTDNLNLQKQLGYAGLIPFIALTVMLYIVPAEELSKVTLAFMTYSACILSFMAGTLWGMNTARELSKGALIVTNLLTISAWITLNLSSQLIPLSLLAVGFIVSYFTERPYSLPNLTGSLYLQMRMRLTTIVVLCHLLFLFGIFYR